MVLLAGALLVGALGVGVEDPAPPVPLDAGDVVELAPPVGQDEPEYPAEGLGSAQEALQPVQGGDDVGAVVPLEQDVDLEPDLDEVEREQGLGVPLCSVK